MKLLIDENLSPKLVEWLGARDVPAQHVVYTGMQGATDPEVWRFALENDFIVVTINASDFIHLAAAADLHAGLIVMRSQGLSRDEQWRWLEPVVDWLLDSGGDLLNKAIEVKGIDDFVVRDLPSS